MFKKTTIPGILGMLLIILALLVKDPAHQRILFLLGAAGMTLMALLEHHKLFIGLQTVIISGTLTAFLPASDTIKGAIPMLVSLPVIMLLYHYGILNTGIKTLGAFALIILGVGYAVQHALIFFLGGFLVTLFSFLEFRSGFRPAVLWMVLNLIFTLLAACNLFTQI